MNVKDTFFSEKVSLNCRGKIIDLSVPKIFGILNVTPDSFFDGGRYSSEQSILEQVQKMLEEGADFIDVGAYSSRPGAENISIYEELKRLETALGLIRVNFPNALISVDTFRSEVVQQVVKNFEVDIINDISAGTLDEKMFDTVANVAVPYVMMHMKGTPADMHINPVYENVTKEIAFYLAQRLQLARSAGIKDIIIDPGIGFGKNIQHNFRLLNDLELFKFFQLPLMIGVSRKSLIYKTLHITTDEALNGTVVLNTVALMKGADLLRVHDVKEARQAILLLEEFKKVNRNL
jgi:dihydropteroate synthase